MELNVDQKDAVIMLQWLIDGGRMTGRSVAIAYYIVEKAALTGNRVKLFDHTELNVGQFRPEAKRYILEKCKLIAEEQFPQYDFKHYLSDNCIALTLKR